MYIYTHTYKSTLGGGNRPQNLGASLGHHSLHPQFAETRLPAAPLLQNQTEIVCLKLQGKQKNKRKRARNSEETRGKDGLQKKKKKDTKNKHTHTLGAHRFNLRSKVVRSHLKRSPTRNRLETPSSTDYAARKEPQFLPNTTRSASSVGFSRGHSLIGHGGSLSRHGGSLDHLGEPLKSRHNRLFQ